MHITVKLFATLRQRAGWSEQQIDLPEGATVHTLLEQLSQTYPDLDLWGRPIYAAVNQSYAQADQALKEGDTVAFFPPVSGGSGSQWLEAS